jgi:hypothetical protein
MAKSVNYMKSYRARKKAGNFKDERFKFNKPQETDLALAVQASKYSDYYEEVGNDNGKTYIVRMQREERHAGGSGLASLDKSTTYEINGNAVEVRTTTLHFGNQYGRGNSRREYKFNSPQEVIAYMDRQISRNKSKFNSGYNEINAQRRQFKKNK